MGVRQPVEQGAQAALIAAVGVERSEFLGAAGEDRERSSGARALSRSRPDRCAKSTVEPVASARA